MVSRAFSALNYFPMPAQIPETSGGFFLKIFRAAPRKRVLGNDAAGIQLHQLTARHVYFVRKLCALVVANRAGELTTQFDQSTIEASHVQQAASELIF